MFDFFNDTGQQSLGARLIRIKQEGSYSEYVKKFVTYSAPLPDMAESVLLDAFLTGLEPSLQAEVISRHPQTLEECMKEAQLANDRNIALKLAMEELDIVEPKRNENSSKFQGKNEKTESKKTEFVMKQVTIPLKNDYQKKDPPIKRLSDTEFRARLDKGLCFRCNEKYAPGHRCKGREKRELMLLILNEEEDHKREEDTEDEASEVIELNHLELNMDNPIELRLITGVTSKGTMKLKGHVNGREVVILIDSGATNNFIS